MTEEIKKNLLKKLNKLRNGKPKLDTSDRYEHGYSVGWDCAFNLVFALLDSKENIKVSQQGEHWDYYYDVVNDILNDKL